MISDKLSGHIWEVQPNLMKWQGGLQDKRSLFLFDYFYFIGKEKDLCLNLIRIIYDQDEKNQILMTNIWLNLVSVCNQAKWSTVCLMFSFLMCLTWCNSVTVFDVIHNNKMKQHKHWRYHWQDKYIHCMRKLMTIPSALTMHVLNVTPLTDRYLHADKICQIRFKSHPTRLL